MEAKPWPPAESMSRMKGHEGLNGLPHMTGRDFRKCTALKHLQELAAATSQPSGCTQDRPKNDIDRHHSLAAGLPGSLFSFLHELDVQVKALQKSAREEAQKILQDLVLLVESIPKTVFHNGSRILNVSIMRQRCDAIGRALVALEAKLRQKAVKLSELSNEWDGSNAAHADTRQAGPDPGSSPGTASGLTYLACIDAIVTPEGFWDPFVLRNAERGSQEALHTPEAPQQPLQRFTRDTTKFWLRPKDVLRFKCETIRHLPVHIFDRQKVAGKLSPQEQLRDWTLISSVYYDTEDMDNYMARLRREDRATAVRIRFYGQRRASGKQEVFLERKTHREAWTGEQSCKERCALQQKDVVPLLSGEALPPHLANNPSSRDFAASVQAEILADGQEAVMRTICTRTAFQEGDSDLVRISLDATVQMTSESGPPLLPSGWCRDERATLPPDEQVIFPYCVVEIKLRLEEPPLWLRDLIASGILLSAPNFSKHLHGIAALFPDRVPCMPYWFLHNNDGSMSAASWEEMAEEDAPDQAEVASWAFPGQTDVPSMSKLSSLFQRKSGDPAGNLSLEAQQNQDAADFQAPGPSISRQSDVRALTAENQATVSQAPTTLNRNLETSQDGLTEGQLQNGAARSTGRSNANSQSRFSMAAQPTLSTAPALAVQEEAGLPEAQHVVCIEQATSTAALPSPKPNDAESKLYMAPGNTRLITAEVEEPPATESLPATVNRFGDKPRSWLTRKSFGLPRHSKSSRGSDTPRGFPTKLTQSSRSKAIVRSRVEPKTFFANERTFLAWLNISVLIMLTGLSLLGGSFSSLGSSSLCSERVTLGPSPGGYTGAGNSQPGPAPDQGNSFNCKASRYAGLAISPVAVLFMVYALFMYKMRTVRILQQRRRVRYDDQHGPILLVVLLVGALLTAMVFTAKAAFG